MATVAYFICSGRNAVHSRFIRRLLNVVSTRVFISSNAIINN
jgi:hypothetical protein